MKKILKALLHPIFVALVGLLVVSLLIWFAGPYFKFGENNFAPLASPMYRLILIMIILVVWGLNNLRVQRVNTKNNEALFDGLAKNQRQSNPGNEQAAEEIQQLNSRFSDAMQTLKKLKFSGGGRNKALYELPWYIIVGPPGSGKTTALVNSSLDFPLAEQFGKGALQGVGGTRNCDWWFTNDAVLIDTAGRYTTQDSHKVVDSSAWEGFLSLLKKNRRRRPINGAIVAISLQDLLTQTEEERILHAKMIRSRLDELMEKLGIRFPIYLMLTKSDLIPGFSEFFEDLGRDDREQVWGVSLPNAPKVSDSPNFEFLNKELSSLLSRINSRVLWRMNAERDVKRRGAIFGFPQQMENLNTIVAAFVSQTFIQNRFKFQPYLRGVYFSSGTQDGTPIDRMMSSLSSNFGFSHDVSQSANQRGKSFFLGQLFRDVVFPESELVGSNVRYETFIKWFQRVGYVAIAAITAGLLLVWSGSITQHKKFMAQVGSFTSEFNVERDRLTDWNKDIRAILPPLNALAKASIVYDQQDHPWLSGLGMYDGRVDENANQAYRAQLKSLLLPRLLTELEENLKEGYQGGDLYNTFRVYMMFNKTDKLDKAVLKTWFETYWDKQFEGEATRRQELVAHLNALMLLDFEPQKLNETLVARTRGTLLRVPVSQRIYARIQADTVYQQKVDMLNYLGDSVRNAFDMNDATLAALNIPVLYTIDGYENVDFSANSPVVADVANERWLLTDDNAVKVDFIEDDFDKIADQVKVHYFADYTKTWSTLFGSLKVAQFDSLTNANEMLLSFVDPVYSPLRAILQVGLENTQLTPPIPEVVSEGAKKSRYGRAANLLANKIKTTPVDKAFNELHVLMREGNSRTAPVEALLQRIQQLQEYVAEVALSPDPSKKAFEIAKARYKSGAGNPITALKAYANTAPKEIKEWLISLSDQTWNVLLSSAHNHVNSQWKVMVYSPYTQGLQGRYPISGSAQEELAMFDFIEFFKPTGTLDAFYQEYVAPFINAKGNGGNRVVDNYSMNFSSESLRRIRKGLSIKRILFQVDPSNPSVAVELKPLDMDEQDAKFSLEVGDQKIGYNHGPKFWKSLKWTGNDDNKRIRLLFEDLSGRLHDKTYAGPWSWFKMIDHANIQKTSRSNVYKLTFSVADHQIQYEARVKSINNALKQNFLSSFKCPASL